MQPRPELLLNRSGKTKVSVILIDWGVRESFHSLHYLNRQTADRDDYELLWLEFYDRKPAGLRQMVSGGTDRSPVLDKWIVLGYPDDSIYHKHRLYNIGILAAEGDICVICDSDAIFQPTFIEKIIQAFIDTPNAVVHLDEIRNRREDLYPFTYPTIEEILGPGIMNWVNGTSLGLDDSPDMLHHANYGACMAARRDDLIAVGGADEHLDYLGYICGPYDLTFRLLNYGRTERWLRDEYLFHTWHPNQYGSNTDHQGPHDGLHMSLLALEARATGRIQPCRPNPWFPQGQGRSASLERLLRLVSQRGEPAWKAANPPRPENRAYWIERNHNGFDVFCQGGRWYARPTRPGTHTSFKGTLGSTSGMLQAATQQELHHQLRSTSPPAESFDEDAGLAIRLWRKVNSQPLHLLPTRIVHKTRRLLASIPSAERTAGEPSDQYQGTPVESLPGGMISVIFCSRVKDNPDSDVQRLLDSAVAFMTPAEQKQVEFLIKYDDDDDQRPSEEILNSYPFPVRTFVWSRGEGRHQLHNAQEYLFTQHDPRSRFCLMIADDFYFTRPNFVSEILSIQDEFCIIGHNRPPIETFARIYEKEEAIRKWVVSFGALAPVISTRLIEVCQNFGWQSNVDSWLMGLSVVLYDLYHIVLWRSMSSFYERTGGLVSGETPTYNNMELTCQKGPENKYWFELLRRQARNLYLNMEYGTDLLETAWSPRRIMRKFRSQPLHRLPIRVYRKVVREVTLVRG